MKFMKNWVFLFILSLFSITAFAQEESYEYKFRLFLKDKGKTNYSIDKPEEFLTVKAIERRKKQEIAIDSADFPISNEYIQAIEELGGIIVAKSKWLKTISVHCTDSSMIELFEDLPFVEKAEIVWRGSPQKIVRKEYPDTLRIPNKKEILFGNYYAYSKDNIKPFEGEKIHEAGYKGKGIDIAIIDAGYSYLPSIELFDKTNIKGHKGFVYGNDDIFNTQSQHGLMVLSCIGVNKPMLFVGTAPEASFWLFGTEDERSEFPIEEDYWANAIEYADSVGVDIVNTSLGYNDFDPPTKGYKHSDLDGKTAYITLAANMATQKGMFLVISAGNSGDSSWHRITPPGDAPGVLTVGAIQRDSTLAGFSSRGPSADMRIKPDVVGLGVSSLVVNNKGAITFASGTSFSSPITCGIVACLWQAYPELNNKELLKIMRESSDRYQNPNNEHGYGIPNIPKAMELAGNAVKRKGKNVIAFFDDFRFESDAIGQIRIIYVGDEPLEENCEIRIMKKDKVVFKKSMNDNKITHSFKTKKKDSYKIIISGNHATNPIGIYF